MSILGKDEQELPLVVDFVNFHGATAHIKLAESGSVQDVSHEICKSYGDCEVKNLEISNTVKITIHRKQSR
jgi:hypothetical protein